MTPLKLSTVASSQPCGARVAAAAWLWPAASLSVFSQPLAALLSTSYTSPLHVMPHSIFDGSAQLTSDVGWFRPGQALPHTPQSVAVPITDGANSSMQPAGS